MLGVVPKTEQLVLSMMDVSVVLSLTLGLPGEGEESLGLHLALVHL